MQASGTLTRAIAAILALAAGSGTAIAGELDYTLRTGLLHSDNINLSETDPHSDNVLVPGLDFTFTQQGADFQADIVGSAEYRDFLRGTYDNQTLAQLSARTNWTVIPQRLDFVVQDYAAVQPLSTLSVDTPDNQQQTNVLSVGPTLHFRMGNTVRGQADLRYINSHASRTSQFDSSRGLAALRLIKDLSPASQLSANVEQRQVDFRERDSGPDYDSTAAYVRYSSKLHSLELDAAAGWSRMDFDNAPAVSSPLVRLDIAWLPTQRQSFSLKADRQYSDAAATMISSGIGNATAVGGTGPSQIDTGDVVIGSQAYLQRRAQLIYGYAGERVELSLASLYERLDYVNDATFDRVGRGGSGGLDIRLRERLTLSAFVNGETFTYQSLSRRDKSLNYGISLTNERTPHWSWMLSLGHRRLDSNLAGISYDANEIYLGVAYHR